jgi:hypothetical protein
VQRTAGLVTPTARQAVVILGLWPARITKR